MTNNPKITNADIDRFIKESSSAFNNMPKLDTKLDPEKLLRDMSKLVRDYNRNNVTITVDMYHQGLPIHYAHPTRGHFIECSYAQAQAVQAGDKYPLRLVKIIDEYRAEFELVLPFFGQAFTPLIPPPYTLPGS